MTGAMEKLSDARTRLRVDVREGAPRASIDPHDLEVMLLERLADDRLRMPPYPAIAMKLQRLAASGRSSTGEIAATISADAALVAAVLRSANAAVYDAARQVVSLDIAIGRLGLEQIIEIAIAQSVGSEVSTAGPLRTLRRDIWRRSLLTAAIASDLAPARGIDRDAAFVAGLLHDFGAITVLVGIEELDVPLPVLSDVTWRRFVERVQPPFGRVFAQRWRLPEPIADAIEHWAEPHRYEGAHRALVGVIASAVAIVSTLDNDPSEGVESLLRLEGLSRSEAERVYHLVPRIAELMNTFEPSTPARTAAARRTTNSAVEAAPAPDVQWPIDIGATCKGFAMRTRAIDPKAVVLVGAEPLELNWLVPIVLDGDPRVDTLANVTACAPQRDGTYRIVARPFALGGDAKLAWFSLVQRARTAAQRPPAEPRADTPSEPAPTGKPATDDKVGEVAPPPPPTAVHEPVAAAAAPRVADAVEAVDASRVRRVPVEGGVTLVTERERRAHPVIPTLVLGALAGILLGIGAATSPQVLGVWIAVALGLGAAGVVWSARLWRTHADR